MPDPEALGLAGEWLEYAREDLHTAQVLVSGSSAPPRQSCWLAQQAAEKAIKSLLVLEQIDFPFTHDLAALRELVPQRYALRDANLDFAPLNRWATEARYPGELQATEADATEAVDLAARVVELVERDFEGEAAG